MSNEKVVSTWEDDLGQCRLIRIKLLHYTERKEGDRWSLVDQGSASERIARLGARLDELESAARDLISRTLDGTAAEEARALLKLVP